MSPTTKRKALISGFSLFIITILMYLPALQNGFVNWDDNDYIYDNLNIQSIDLSFFKWAFTSFHSSNWHPLTWISHAADYAVWGLDPMGHHLTSIILHGLNTFLVVVLVTKLVGIAYSSREEIGLNVPLAAGIVTGLLFGLHPVHVESVAWVSERKDLLCAFFFLLSIIYYLKYAASSAGRNMYIFSLLFFALALMSKPMAVTLPVVLIILDMYPLERLSIKKIFSEHKKVLIEKIPFFGLSIASCLITIAAQHAGSALTSSETLIFSYRILTAFRSIMFYLGNMIWPAGLAPIYPYPREISFTAPEYWGAFILTLSITLICILAKKRRNVCSAAWAYFIVTLLPVLGIIQAGEQSSADRYTYLPSLGPFILISLGLVLLYKKWVFKPSTPLHLKTVCLIPALSIMLVFPVLSIDQIRIWKDSFVLWETQVERYPDSYTGYRGLGMAYGSNGDLKKSITHLNRAIELNPQDYISYSNRAIAYGTLNIPDKAIVDFKKAIELDPQKADLHINLGITHGKMGNHKKAIKSFNRAIELDYMLEKVYFYRGIMYMRSGRKQLAIRDLTTAALMGNEDAKAHLSSQNINQ